MSVYLVYRASYPLAHNPDQQWVGCTEYTPGEWLGCPEGIVVHDLARFADRDEALLWVAAVVRRLGFDSSSIRVPGCGGFEVAVEWRP